MCYLLGSRRNHFGAGGQHDWGYSSGATVAVGTWLVEAMEQIAAVDMGQPQPQPQQGAFQWPVNMQGQFPLPIQMQMQMQMMMAAPGGAMMFTPSHIGRAQSWSPPSTITPPSTNKTMTTALNQRGSPKTPPRPSKSGRGDGGVEVDFSSPQSGLKLLSQIASPFRRRSRHASEPPVSPFAVP